MQDDIWLQDGETGDWLRFREPVGVIQATRLPDVAPQLATVERHVADGLTAVGFLTYEAAGGFDSALQTHPGGPLPLLWFALFRGVAERRAALPGVAGTYALGPWAASDSAESFASAIDRIRTQIAQGATYQVNYSFRLRAPFSGDPQALFREMTAAQRGQFGAYIDIGRFAIASASPELFFTLDGDRLTARPMKGTVRRGLTLAQDRALAEWLQQSEKNRAENVMIVDMIRNDVSRVARLGSVTVPALFEVARYPTLWQMTSRVSAETDASLTDIMHALFPCASITGAPKVRTMQLIRDLEATPRGVYTGAIGLLAPGRRAQFNVAIRTVVVDKAEGTATYGVGSGVVWDSVAADEYAECLLKARVVTRQPTPFALLESLLWQPDDGYVLLDRHLARLGDSADYFAFPFDAEAVRERLLVTASELTQPSKVRLLLSANGVITVEAAALGQPATQPLRVALAAEPIASDNPFLYHKTTERAVYERALASRPQADAVLLWNERGEITEGHSANVVVELDGQWVTPPLESGLLAGTLRAQLLDDGVIVEQIITRADLTRATRMWLVNSVRGWVAAVLLEETWRDSVAA